MVMSAMTMSKDHHVLNLIIVQSPYGV